MIYLRLSTTTESGFDGGAIMMGLDTETSVPESGVELTLTVTEMDVPDGTFVGTPKVSWICWVS